MSGSTASTSNIYQRLCAVMKDCGYIQKDGYNSFSKYKYVTHDAVVEHVRKALIENGVAVVTSVPEVEFPPATATNAGKTNNICRVKLLVKFVNIDNPSELIESEFWGEASDTSDKAIYKAISGAKKYAFTNMFMLATGDDPEQDSPQYNQGKPEQNKPSKKNEQSTGADLDPRTKYKAVRQLTGLDNEEMMASFGGKFKSMSNTDKLESLTLLEDKHTSFCEIKALVSKYRLDDAAFSEVSEKCSYSDPWYTNTRDVLKSMCNALYIKGEEQWAR